MKETSTRRSSSKGNENVLDHAWPDVGGQPTETFRSGKRDRAPRLAGHAYGPLAPMMTDSGEDVWSVWKNRVIPRRGDIVHGWVEAPSTEETALVLLLGKTADGPTAPASNCGRETSTPRPLRAALEPAI